jgi:lipoprotein-anchoring transpeptidase ErfK/SrfK
VNRGFRAALAFAGGTLGAGVLAGPSLANTHAHAVPSGIRIAGVRVGGLAPGQAAAAVRAAFAKPLPLVVNGKKIELHPARLATAYVESAVGRARSSTPGTNVHLVVAVHGAALRATAAALSRRFDRVARDAQLRLVNGKPRVTHQANGVTIDENDFIRRVTHALTGNMRLPVRVHPKTVRPEVTTQSLGPVILIDRSKNRLSLFHDDNALWRVFPVATGQAIYPTPTGRFNIVVKQVDPWWYPPTYDSWAQGLSPVPPGPNNPLGTRWMGLSAPGVGIHGTDAPSSIGWNASHGCIRMQVPDAEWLFVHVKIGTTVFIV